MTDVVEINDIESLQSYHLAWTDLHARTPHASFFQTLEWLETYWAHQGDGQRLRVMVVRSNGRPIGIVPLVERDEPTRLGSVRVLTYPLDNWAARFGPVGPHQTATLTLAMRRIAEAPRTWDVFAPRWIPHESSDRGRSERAMRLAGMSPIVETHTETSVLALSSFDDWDEYLASRSAKVRHEIRRQRRRLEQRHRVEFVRWRPDPLRYGGGDPRWDLYRLCLQIAERSWQAVSRTGNTLSHGAVAEHLAEAHRSAARIGMLDLSLLFLDGEPAAYYYAYHCQGEVIGLRTGFDPAFSGGVGSVLLGRVIQDGFDRGDRRLDLGVGGEPYKRRLRTGVETGSRLTHIAPGAWRPQTLWAARWVRDRLLRVS